MIYPALIIFIEIGVIMAQKNLLSSLKTEQGEDYKLLLREDITLIRTYEKIANYFINRISLLIGIKQVEQALTECIEKYPNLTGCYIGMDERLKTKALEDTIDEITEKNIANICEAFSFLLSKLIELYAAFVPYKEIVETLEQEISRIDKRVITYFTPFALFKLILEPYTREFRGDNLKNLRVSSDIKGIQITKKGEINYHTIYRYNEAQKEEKFIYFLNQILSTSTKSQEIKKGIIKTFRKLPHNLKEELYIHEFIKKLPEGILEEEKIVLTSKEKLIDELIDRKTKLEEAYTRLSDAKLDKMKSNFIDIVAHELKTPLTSIKTYTDLLRKEKLGSLNKLQKEKLTQTSKNIERLTRLIDDMLQIPSIDAKELEFRQEQFFVKDMVTPIIDEIEDITKEKKQKIRVTIDDQSTILGDKTLIEKAIKNIVINAIKYTPKKGTITITVKKDNEFTKIFIQDTGKGIEKENIDKIFEPFYSLEKGAGLGLSIAKNIIESHNGTITVASNIGKGSKFCVTLRGEK
jgi:signal transduction histidine kinase